MDLKRTQQKKDGAAESLPGGYFGCSVLFLSFRKILSQQESSSPRCRQAPCSM